MAGGLAERLELLEPRQLGHVDLAGEVRANRALERVVRAEVAARQRPGPAEGRLGALPEQHAEGAVAHLQHDGERDVGGRRPAPPPGRRAGFRLRVGVPGILRLHRFSIIDQKPREETYEANRAAHPVARGGARPRSRPDRPPSGRGARPRRGAQRRDPRPQLPGARGPGRGALRGRLARPVAQGGGHRRRRDRLLRRPLHGRDRLDPQPRQDRPAARPRRRLLAGRLDHGRPAARLEGQAPRRDRRDVREHDRRGEGGDRLLLHVLERGAGRRAHPARARRRRGDPVRPGHVAGRLRRARHRPAHARLGRRVPRARRDPPGGHHRGARRPPRAPSS